MGNQRIDGEYKDQPQRVWYKQRVLLPDAYAWLVFAASLDIMMTRVMLHLGAAEMNSLAASMIEIGGLWGLIVLKFGLLAAVLTICEYVGRHNLRTCRNLVYGAIAINLFPVVVSIAQLVLFL